MGSLVQRGARFGAHNFCRQPHDTSLRLVPAAFAILLTPGRIAPFPNRIFWLSIQRSPRKPPPQAFATSSSAPSAV